MLKKRILYPTEIPDLVSPEEDALPKQTPVVLGDADSCGNGHSRPVTTVKLHCHRVGTGQLKT